MVGIIFMCILIGLVLAWYFAKSFSDIAEMKGHDGDSYFWLVFFFGVVGMLMVAALPDNNVENNTERILNLLRSSANEKNNSDNIDFSEVKVCENITTSKDPNKQNASISAIIKDGEKVCPKCGTAQKVDRHVCWSCGQHFDN